ncbi:MAG: hypothetical protein H6719_34035 [Sandaracinaceae bacterium]|nr:hypothetical protein [Sandaracinaceae bacterium]
MQVVLPSLFCLLVSLALTNAALAQADDVALVVTGEDAEVAGSAFESFVAVDAARRLDVAPVVPDASVGMLVSIDTDGSVVRVWRRRDGVTLERAFDARQDGYALAVVASELLEVARTGADPASVGATVVEVAPVEAEPVPEATDTTDAVDATAAADTTDAPAAVDDATLSEPGAANEDGGWRASFTPGVGVEGWLSTEGEPWIVQPTLFLEVLAGPATESWRIGGALFASALGAWSFESAGVEGTYARHDFGARLTVGGDVGPVDTRLLGHVRVGGSAVVVSASEGRNEDSVAATRAGWFVGLGLDARQPLIAGLEVFLDLSADLLPAPLRFTAGGATVVLEPSVRLGGRLGLAWRLP